MSAISPRPEPRRMSDAGSGTGIGEGVWPAAAGETPASSRTAVASKEITFNFIGLSLKLVRPEVNSKAGTNRQP